MLQDKVNKKPEYLKIAVMLGLVIATLTVYWQIKNFDFVNYDDWYYIVENIHVQGGITKDGIVWAFTTFLSPNWHPVTWLSLMLDAELFLKNPGGYHWTSLLFHMANVILLFLVLYRMTGALWKSGFVAALFAIHPLHIESVAWISERKDVLSAFFGWLTVLAYIRYASNLDKRHYMTVLLLFTLGLMSKPMLVTLPFILILLDFWPLGRIKIAQLRWKTQDDCMEASIIRILIEKIPLLLLSVIISVITYSAQTRAMTPITVLPLDVRIANALYSYACYIQKMLWPSELAVFYPHPLKIPLGLPEITGIGIALIAVTIFALRKAKKYPYLAVGWLWYLGTLVPVMGFVQVGLQGMADRYTYFPLVGLYIVIAWGIPDCLKSWNYQKTFLFVSAVIIIAVLMIVSINQVKYWQNGQTLFEHCLKVTQRNYIVHNMLGSYLRRTGRIPEAMIHFEEAIKIAPDFVFAYQNMGYALQSAGRHSEAIPHYLMALKLKPDDHDIYHRLGVAYMEDKDYNQAISLFRKALDLNPQNAAIYNSLGMAFMNKGKLEKAYEALSKTVDLQPDHAGYRNNLAMLYVRQGKSDMAIFQYRKAIAIQPDYANAHYYLAKVLECKEQYQEAQLHYERACSINPAYKDRKSMMTGLSFQCRK